MKTLFLVFYGFQEYNGISKKIRYQADALRLCGADVRTCHYEVGNDGSRKWMIDEDVLADLGKGIPAKIKKRLSFAPILQYVRREGIQCVYIRSYHNANPFTIHFVRMLKKQGVRVLLEIPTYPYDHEYSSGMEKVQLYTDKLFRHAFCRYVFRSLRSHHPHIQRNRFRPHPPALSPARHEQGTPPDRSCRNPLLAWFRPVAERPGSILRQQPRI